jgi:hypothetical protein
MPLSMGVGVRGVNNVLFSENHAKLREIMQIMTLSTFCDSFCMFNNNNNKPSKEIFIRHTFLYFQMPVAVKPDQTEDFGYEFFSFSTFF